MRIDEPATFATDLALAALTGFLAARLLRAGGGPGRGPARTWGFAFVALAAASLLGGLEHGLGPSLGPGPDGDLWTATLVALGAATLLLPGAAIHAAFRPPLRGGILASVLGVLAGVDLLVVAVGAFTGAMALYGAAFAVVLGILFLAPACREGKARWWVLGGAAVSAAAGAVQVGRLDLHPSFNHNDLYHCIEAPGLWLLYRGGLLLRE